MIRHLEKALLKCEQQINKLVQHIDYGIDVLLDFPRDTLELFNDFITTVFESIYSQANKSTTAAKLMRWFSLPWSKLILEGYKYFYLSKRKQPIFKPGVHMVRASVGGGKSLLSFILGELYRMQTGLGSYYTSPVEKPRLTDDGRFFYTYHRLINLDDYFDDQGNKIKKFNTEKHKIIHKDERHLEFNPRQNGTSEYKSKFLPQQKDEILMRHQGITHIYKYTQYMKLDSQDMQALTFMHDVSTAKDIPLERWLEDGLFNIIPLKLKIQSFVLDVNFTGDMKRKKVASYTIEVPCEILQHYDTHAERYRDEGLKLDYK